MENKKTILYAEDDKNLRELMAGVIQESFPNNKVETFEDGTCLEKRLNSELEDVGATILDNQMPGILGSEIIKKYANKKEFEKIPFILAYGGAKSIGEQAVRDGCLGYLIKPFSLSDLTGTIKKALDYSKR